MAISSNRVNPRDQERDKHDEQLHKVLDRIMAFGQENGWDHPVVILVLGDASEQPISEKVDGVEIDESEVARCSCGLVFYSTEYALEHVCLGSDAPED